MKKRTGLFNGHWYSMSGQRLRRLTRSEIAECYRLWAKHRDVRAGRAQEKAAA